MWLAVAQLLGSVWKAVNRKVMGLTGVTGITLSLLLTHRDVNLVICFHWRGTTQFLAMMNSSFNL